MGCPLLGSKFIGEKYCTYFWVRQIERRSNAGILGQIRSVGRTLPRRMARHGKGSRPKLLRPSISLWLDSRPVAEVDMPSAEPNRLPAPVLPRLVGAGRLTADAH